MVFPKFEKQLRGDVTGTRNRILQLTVRRESPAVERHVSLWSLSKHNGELSLWNLTVSVSDRMARRVLESLKGRVRCRFVSVVTVCHAYDVEHSEDNRPRPCSLIVCVAPAFSGCVLCGL